MKGFFSKQTSSTGVNSRSAVISNTESKVFTKSGPPSSSSSTSSYTSSYSSPKLRSLMTRTRERCLISFIVMTIFGVVQLHLILSYPRHAHNHPIPCPSQPGIHWVRDPDSCSRYFICVASQPIWMPPCPDNTVWSVGGKNCVPVNSMWDDCPHASDRMDALVDPLHPEDEWREKLLGLLPNHPCAFSGEAEIYLPHPGRCHWFYNCSAPVTDDVQTSEADLDGWDDLTEECPYPKLFSLASHSCQHYSMVDCGTRGLFFDPCEYRQLHCQTAHCQPCHLRHGSCVGMRDGLQPHPDRKWTPRHLVCKDQRAVNQLDCSQDKPIFSPETRRCENLMDIPKAHGGSQPSCEGRHDGRYWSDDMEQCDVFYECANHVIHGRYQCLPGTVFHPEKQSCRRRNARGVPPPCNNSTSGPASLSLSLFLCRGMEDGLYADLYGRCPLYYECQESLLKKYHRCNFGTFDPRSQNCQFSVSHVPAPCGERSNPCMDKTDGQYADLTANCQSSFHCRRSLVARQRSCPPGTVFNEGKKSCQLPNDTPPPCGLAPSCTGKADGRYPSPLKGCQFYYTCRAGLFRGYGQCSIEGGGFYFNDLSGSCDFPQNVCSPCGIRTENCTVSASQP